MHIDKHVELQQLEEAHPPQITFQCQLLDAVGQAVIATDLDGTITCWNRAAETLYGWTSDEVLGRNIVDVTPAFSTHEEAEKIMDMLRAGESWTGAFPVERSDGSVFSAQVTNNPIYDETGEVVGIVGVSNKITAQGIVRRKLKAKQEAEEMARLKSAFLTNMSHEIRTPLAGILGFAEIIADEAVGEVREYAEIIGQCGERLMDTLNSVFDLARLESGSMQLAPEHFDVVQQIQELLPVFERQTREGRYLRLEPEAPHLFANLDQGAFSRILTNLISNGLKFTEHGGVTIRLGEATGHIWIKVTDTGIGISEAFLSRLFEEFQQESVGLTRSYEGMGLCLPITKRLVDLMDGTINVESKKEVGTTFTVRLPVNGNR